MLKVNDENSRIRIQDPDPGSGSGSIKSTGIQLKTTGTALKGLSHEIDFKNFDKNLQHLT